MKNKLDDFFKGKFEGHTPTFEEKYWEQAERLLDAQEDKPSRKTFWFWFLPLLFIGIGAAWFFLNDAKNAVTSHTVLIESIVTESENVKDENIANIFDLELNRKTNLNASTELEKRKELIFNSLSIDNEAITASVLEKGNIIVNKEKPRKTVLKASDVAKNKKTEIETPQIIKTETKINKLESEKENVEKKGTNNLIKSKNIVQVLNKNEEILISDESTLKAMNILWKELEIKEDALENEVEIDPEVLKELKKNTKKLAFGLSGEVEIFETLDESSNIVSALKIGAFINSKLTNKWNLQFDVLGSRRQADYKFQEITAQDYGFGKKTDTYFISSNQQYFLEPSLVLSRKLGTHHKIGLGFGGDLLLTAKADLYKKQQLNYVVGENLNPNDNFTTTLESSAWWNKIDARKWSSFIQLRYEYQMNKRLSFITKVYGFKNNLIYLNPNVSYDFKTHFKASLGASFNF